MDKTREEVTLILTIGMIGMFVLAVSIILFVILYKRKILKRKLRHQQELIQTAVEIQEEERKRFAADLHDEIGSGISTTLLSLSDLENGFNDQTDTIVKIKSIRTQLNYLLDTVREISYNITPSSLEAYGLLATIGDLCYQIQESGKLTIDFKYEGIEERIPFSKELAIYRICKELLTNTIKHAEASEIKISLVSKNRTLKLLYEDNGKGFVNDLYSKGMGMNNMVNRAKILDAEFSIEGIPNKGVKAHLSTRL